MLCLLALGLPAFGLPLRGSGFRDAFVLTMTWDEIAAQLSRLLEGLRAPCADPEAALELASASARFNEHAVENGRATLAGLAGQPDAQAVGRSAGGGGAWPSLPRPAAHALAFIQAANALQGLQFDFSLMPDVSSPCCRVLGSAGTQLAALDAPLAAALSGSQDPAALRALKTQLYAGLTTAAGCAYLALSLPHQLPPDTMLAVCRGLRLVTGSGRVVLAAASAAGPPGSEAMQSHEASWSSPDDLTNLVAVQLVDTWRLLNLAGQVPESACGAFAADVAPPAVVLPWISAAAPWVPWVHDAVKEGGLALHLRLCDAPVFRLCDATICTRE